MQQRAGVQLKGGVGQVGDQYEQHADAVANLVVQGKSAEALLSEGESAGKTANVVQAYGGTVGNSARPPQNRSPSRRDLEFRRKFSQHFPKIAPSFPQQVETLFSRQQKLFLNLLWSSGVLPARGFFTANDPPGLTVQLKILVAGAMLIFDRTMVARTRHHIMQQKTGALNCGDWARRVWEYAGIRTKRGKDQSGVAHENRHGMPKDYTEVIKPQTSAVSLSQFRGIRSGDWVMIKWRHVPGNVRNHSFISVRWLDSPRNPARARRRKALVMEQNNNTHQSNRYREHWIGCDTQTPPYVYAVMSAKPPARRSP